ncbi:hypothetical protein [Nitratireductor sp. GCM10026969]|uniref:hypothetical protein n=1 Tax=Nitratireductor sp. GCM10026969 TaxID=3252645 RepID=UPI00361A0DE7
MSTATRGKRLTWRAYEALTGHARPAGAIDRPKPKPRPLRLPANDNRPPRGVPVPLPEHVEQRVTAGGTSTPMRIRANLQRTAPDAFRTLVSLDELLHPPRVADNDNDASAADDDNSGVGHERVHNQGCIKPSPDTVLRAYFDGMRPRVVLRRDGTMERFQGGVRYETGDGGHEFVEIGGYYSSGEFYGLQFYRGELIAYSDANGRKKTPWYDATRAAEASKDKKEKEAERNEELAWIRFYLGPIVHGYLADCYRIGKKRLSFFSPGAARDYGRLAGVSEAKGVGECRTSAPAPDALAEIDRAASAEYLISRLDDTDASRIRRIIDADSFSEIALAEGASPSSAHKVGRGLCIKTLQRIEQLLAA